MDATQSIVGSLESDHRAIAEILTNAVIADPTRDGLVQREQLVIALVRHFVGEEQYLYPAARRFDVLDAGAADAHLADDRELENRLRALEAHDLTPSDLTDVLASVRAAFGAEVRGAEQLAPTRPRRVAPHDETANKLVSFVEGYLDHVRDYYTHRGALPDPE